MLYLIRITRTYTTKNELSRYWIGYFEVWGDRWGSNPRQPEPQSGALPTELRPPSVMRIECIV